MQFLPHLSKLFSTTKKYVFSRKHPVHIVMQQRKHDQPFDFALTLPNYLPPAIITYL